MNTSIAATAHDQSPLRRWLVRWMYAAALVHLLVGLLMPWLGHAVLLEGYHRSVEAAFWGSGAPVGARELQVWWLAIFGATLQTMALWMLALVWLADKRREPWLWLWLIVGLLLWAPQDIVISARAGIWINVAADCLALLLMLPPLAWLCRCDFRHRAA